MGPIKEVERKAALVLALKAAQLSATITQELSKAGTGRTYATHTASAPGEPPAADTGKLKGSVKVSGRGLVRTVSINAPYAYGLEFGTRTVAPRPFARPSITKFRRSQ